MRAAVAAAVEAGELRGGAREVAVERPRSKDHGDYATSVALQLAKPAGRPPREVAELSRAAAPGRRRRRGRRRRPRLPQRPARAGGAGRVAVQVVAAGPAYGAQRRAPAARQPGVRQRQPDRTDAHRRHAVGGGRRRARRGCSRPAAPRSPASTTSTTRACRSTGSPRRCRRGNGPAGAGGRLRRRVRRRVGPAGPGAGARTLLDRRTRRSASAVARPAGRPGGDPASLESFGVTFDVWFSELSLRVRRGRARAGAAARAGPRLRGGRRGLAAHDRLRGRQGPGRWSSPTGGHVLPVRRRLLRRQARRGASTRASTCSAPTTTATSAGCGHSRPVRATTRSRPRGPDRSAGQRPAGRRAGADEQAGRDDRHPRGPRRADRRRRGALRAGPVVSADTRWTSTSTCDAAEQRQPGLLRAVRRDPRGLRAAQRGRARHRRARPRRRRPVAAGAPARDRAAPGARGVPAGRRDRRRAARAAPRRALPRGEGRQGGAALLGRVPGAAQGRRGGRRRRPRRGCCCGARRAPSWRTASRLLGVSAPERM